MNELTLKIFDRIFNPKRLDFILMLLDLFAVLFLCWYVVYSTGGTAYAYIHVFYIPIILAGFFFSIPGGLLTGIISGIIVGPLMPMDTALNLAQPTSSWFTRLLFFTLVGFLAGLGSSLFRRYLKDLKERYTTNAITGLLNLNGLEESFSQLKLHHASTDIILIDLGNVNEIEQAVGTPGVQELLKQMAEELKSVLPEGFVLGHPRYASFVLLGNNAGLLEGLRGTLKQSFQINNIPIFVERYFGIARYPDDDRSLPGLIRKARMAIEQAKERAAYISKYTPLIKEHTGESVILLNDLNQAIENDDLQVYYQPKMDLKTGKTTGVEALVRWFHKEKGEISPAQFIPLMEKTLLINAFTKSVLTKSLRDMARWQNSGLDLKLAVNFSIRNFHDQTTFADLFSLIQQLHLNPHNIEIEITESAFSAELSQVTKATAALRDKGLKVTIDDFGTGLASQQYLFELPVDGLKIDQIFVRELAHKPAARAIVQSAIALGHQLNLMVTAEGIETQAQLKMIQEMGCDFGQGYLIAKPMTYDNLITWLGNRNSNMA